MTRSNPITTNDVFVFAQLCIIRAHHARWHREIPEKKRFQIKSEFTKSRCASIDVGIAKEEKSQQNETTHSHLNLNWGILKRAREW